MGQVTIYHVLLSWFSFQCEQVFNKVSMQLIQKLHMKGTTLIDKHTKERTDSQKSTTRCLHYTESPCNHKESG